jgi:hypothetical protein
MSFLEDYIRDEIAHTAMLCSIALPPDRFESEQEIEDAEFEEVTE